MRPKTLGSLMELAHFTQHDLHILVPEKGYTIAENRSHSVVQAMRNESDYLLFIDDDMTFEKDLLERLLEGNKEVLGVNSKKKEVIGTAYGIKSLPQNTTVGFLDENGGYKDPSKYPAFEMEMPKEPFKAYFVGTGIMLIDTKVFAKLEKPYFFFETNVDGLTINGEDGYFCNKCREAGIDVWCDPTIPVGHLGEIEF